MLYQGFARRARAQAIIHPITCITNITDTPSVRAPHVCKDTCKHECMHTVIRAHLRTCAGGRPDFQGCVMSRLRFFRIAISKVSPIGWKYTNFVDYDLWQLLTSPRCHCTLLGSLEQQAWSGPCDRLRQTTRLGAPLLCRSGRRQTTRLGAYLLCRSGGGGHCTLQG